MEHKALLDEQDIVLMCEHCLFNIQDFICEKCNLLLCMECIVRVPCTFGGYHEPCGLEEVDTNKLTFHSTPSLRDSDQQESKEGDEFDFQSYEALVTRQQELLLG